MSNANSRVQDNGALPHANPTHGFPNIENEAADIIQVGGQGKLYVPREDLDTDLDDGAEMDLISTQPMKIRKPGRREWIVLKRDSEWTTHLLLHKPREDSYDVEYYYVDKPLRRAIRDDLKQVRVFLYYSVPARSTGLWVVNVTPGNSWYESLHALLQQPADFFATKVIRVFSDKEVSRYRVKHMPHQHPVSWPEQETGDLLAEALGANHFITSPDHPVYRDLVEGADLHS